MSNQIGPNDINAYDWPVTKKVTCVVIKRVQNPY